MSLFAASPACLVDFRGGSEMKMTDIYIRNRVLLSLIFNVLITVQWGAAAGFIFIQLRFNFGNGT